MDNPGGWRGRPLGHDAAGLPGSLGCSQGLRQEAEYAGGLLRRAVGCSRVIGQGDMAQVWHPGRPVVTA